MKSQAQLARERINIRKKAKQKRNEQRALRRANQTRRNNR